MHYTTQSGSLGHRAQAGSLCHYRRGATLTELVVAASLLVSTLAIVASLTVHTGRLWQDVRQHQLAMDELSNQLERLIGLDEPRRVDALGHLTPSENVRAALPNARLTVETARDADGTRLIASIQWDRPTRALPLSLVGWIDAQPAGVLNTQGAQP